MQVWLGFRRAQRPRNLRWLGPAVGMALMWGRIVRRGKACHTVPGTALLRATTRRSPFDLGAGAVSRRRRDARQERADRCVAIQGRSLQPVGLLPGQDHSQDHHGDGGRADGGRHPARQGSQRKGPLGEAGELVEDARGPLRERARDPGRPQGADGAARRWRKRAILRSTSTTISSSAPPRSRSPSCWPPPISSPASSICSGGPAALGGIGLLFTAAGVFAPNLLHLFGAH